MGRPGPWPRKEGQGLPEATQRGNRMRGWRHALESGRMPQRRHGKTAPLMPAAQPSRLPNGRPCLSCQHDGAFPLPKYLFGAAGELLRPGGADPRGLASADQIEPAAGGPSRARSRPPRQPGRRRNPGRQAPAGRRGSDRDGLCRPPVRSFRSAARRRPRHPARRGDRRRWRPPRHPAQGLRSDPVFAPRRWPCGAWPGAARIRGQRGDGGARHSDHALACGRDHRRKRDARNAAAGRGSHPRRREPHPGRHVPVFRGAWRY